MAQIRRNMAKKKLAQGGVVSVVSGESTPEIIDFLGQFGFDGAWLESEHGAVDFADIGDMTRACDLWGMTSVARVTTNAEWLIGRTLDRGATGICVPHVNTKEDAIKVVNGAKFAPIGYRGGYTGRQGYGVDGFVNKINDEILLVILIEDIEAINNLEEILTVDDIDVFFIAPTDLAQSMGLPGQADHPDVQSTIDKAVQKIVGAGRVAGALANDKNIERHINNGVRFLLINWGSWVKKGAQDYISKVNSLEK